MNNERRMLLNKLEIVRLKNEAIAEKNKRIQDKNQYKNLAIKYREMLKQKDIQIQKMQKKIEEKENELKKCKEVSQIRPNIIKKIWMRVIGK